MKGGLKSPAADATLSTCPWPCDRRIGANVWQPLITPKRSTSRVQRQFSRGNSPPEPALLTPALLTTRSTGRPTAAARPFQSSIFVTSHRVAFVLAAPAAVARRAVSSAPFTSTSESTRCALRRESSRARARPKPPPAPVMTQQGDSGSDMGAHRTKTTEGRPATAASRVESSRRVRTQCRRARTISRSDLAEAAALERRVEQLLDTTEDLLRPRVGGRGEGRLHLAEGLELAEELHVPQARRARQPLPDAFAPPRERVEPEAHGADPPRLGVLAEVRVEDRRHDRFEDRRLVFAVPHVLEDEEIARVGLRPPVEVGAGREQLEQLHDAPVAQGHALGAHLEHHALVLREELLTERRTRQQAPL